MRLSSSQFLLLLLILLGGSSAQARAAESLTFAKVLKLGLERSIEAKRAALAAQLAADDRRILSYENDPHLVVSGNWSNYRPRSGTPPLGSSGGVGRDEVYAAQLSATLYDFGRHDKRMEQADYAEQVKQLAAAEVTESLSFSIARAYAGVLAAERTLHITGEQVVVEAEQLSDQRLNYQRGLRPESDVVMAEVTLGRAQLAATKAQDDARASRISLGLLVGEEQQPLLDGPVPAASVNRSDAAHWDQLLTSWQQFHKGAAQLRREQEARALQVDTDLVDAVKRPLLQGGLAATRSGAWGGEQRNVYTGQIGLSWDLPWDGMARDEVHRIGLRRSDLGLQDDLERKVRSDLDATAREQFRAGKSQLAALMAQVRLIDREHELVQRRYRAGKASALEVSAAEADLLTQRLAVVTTLNALALRVIDVAQARAETALERIFD